MRGISPSHYKAPEYKLNSYRLGDVALQLGLRKKTNIPDLSGDVNREAGREYNMNDCKVVYEIWVSQNLFNVLQNLSVYISSYVHDCYRYVTGELGILTYLSFVASRGFKVS